MWMLDARERMIGLPAVAGVASVAAAAAGREREREEERQRGRRRLHDASLPEGPPDSEVPGGGSSELLGPQCSDEAGAGRRPEHAAALVKGAGAGHTPAVPTSPTATRNRFLAGAVVIGGVAAMLAFDAAHQNEQTATLSRQWVGEQWDVARHCLLGTPIGRGEAAGAIQGALDRQLVQTLAAASEADEEPDPDALWPGRCAALFPSLRADRSILNGDPEDAIETLDVLAPRVLQPGPPGPAELAVGETRARARALIEPIARLDAVMPSGAEYDAEEYAVPDTGMPAGTVLDSLACPPVSGTRRPFPAPGASLVDELTEGERSLRLSAGPDGAFELATASAEGTEVRALSRLGAGQPVLWDAHTLLWLAADAPRVTRRALDADEDGPSVSVGDGAPFDALALCRGRSQAHLVLSRGARRFWARWDGASDAVEPVPMPALGSSPIVACDDRTLAVAWIEDEGWRGAVCDDGRCEAMPPLDGAADLQLAVAGTTLAVGRGRRTDLPLARVLRREHGRLSWSDPVAVARGALSTEGSRFRIAPCAGGAFVSEDGRRWEGEGDGAR